jgi:hypothetical protein
MPNTCNITQEVLLLGSLFNTLEDVTKDVDLFIEYSIENSGIGPYEFWGQRCYDHGENYAVIDNWHLQPEEWMTPEIIDYIDNYIENHIEEVEDKLTRIFNSGNW